MPANFNGGIRTGIDPHPVGTGGGSVARTNGTPKGIQFYILVLLSQMEENGKGNLEKRSGI